MEIREMSMAQIETRISEITELLKAEDADIDALTSEVDELEKRQKEIKEAAEKRSALASKIAGGFVGKIVDKVEKGGNEKMEERTYGIDSVEYRNAFLKRMLSQPLTDVEQRALKTGITGHEEGVGTDVSEKVLQVPKVLQTRIWDLMTEQHPILGDIDMNHTGVVMEIPVNDGVSDAEIVEEDNAASAEMTFAFKTKTLAGKDFTCYFDITYAMSKMQLSAFENFMVNKISEKLGYKLAKDAFKTAVAGSTLEPVTGITYANICNAFGSLDHVNGVTIYTKRNTFYKELVSLTDDRKRPLFQADPTGKAFGTILGADIKIEDAVNDGEIVFCDPKQIVYNMVQDILVESDKDIKKHVITYSGYARGEGVLVNGKGLNVLKKGA